jgi:hypothetical protein
MVRGEAHSTPLYSRARICKCLWGIDSGDRFRHPKYIVALRAGTANRVVVLAQQDGNRFLGSLKGLQIQALASGHIIKDDVNGFSSISNICFMTLPVYSNLKLTLSWIRSQHPPTEWDLRGGR